MAPGFDTPRNAIVPPAPRVCASRSGVAEVLGLPVPPFGANSLPVLPAVCKRDVLGVSTQQLLEVSVLGLEQTGHHTESGVATWRRRGAEDWVLNTPRARQGLSVRTRREHQGREPASAGGARPRTRLGHLRSCTSLRSGLPGSRCAIGEAAGPESLGCGFPPRGFPSLKGHVPWSPQTVVARGGRGFVDTGTEGGSTEGHRACRWG